MYRFRLLIGSAILVSATSIGLAQEKADDAKPSDTPAAKPAEGAADAKPAEKPVPAEKPAAPPQEAPAKEAPAQEAPAKPKEAPKPEPQKDKPAESKPSPSDEKPEAKKPEDKGTEAKPEDKKPEPKPPAKPAKPTKQPIASIGYTDTPKLPGQPWRVHDLMRPRPAVVQPGKQTPADPPSDAIILFDGKDLSNWAHRDREHGLVAARWKVENGYMEATRGTGSIYSLDNLGSCQLHLEWATPVEVKGNGQGRGNSGIKFLGMYEMQVLDSYNNRTYADGQAGSIYGQYPPKVNACRKPGEWQTYDIIFEIAEFDDSGKLTKPAYMTVFHNGVLLHLRQELSGPTGRGHARYSQHPPAGTIMLQDHGNPVRYRNIWARRLK